MVNKIDSIQLVRRVTLYIFILTKTLQTKSVVVLFIKQVERVVGKPNTFR